MQTSFFQIIDGLAHHWLSWMVEMAWQSALLVTVLLILDRVYRRRSARFLHAVWLLILLRLFIPPSTSFPTGIGWWVRPATTQTVSTTKLATNDIASKNGASKNGASTNGASNRVAADDVSRVDRERRHHTTLDPIDRARTADRRPAADDVFASATAVSRTSPESFPWITLAFLVWGAIVTARVGMFTTAWLTIRRWVADSSVIEDRRLIRVWDSACQKAKMRRVPMLRDSQLCSTPLVVGVRQPQVLVPNTILDCLDEAELESVFIHELMHIRRRDAIVRLSAALAETVYFMFPWIWLATWRLSRLREDACDESTVIALKGKRKPYGSAILKTAEMVGYQPPSFALGMRDSHRTPRGRLERLLDAQLPLAPTPPVRTIATLLLMAFVFLPGGARPADSDTHSPTNKSGNKSGKKSAKKSDDKTSRAEIDATPNSQGSDGTTPNPKARTSHLEFESATDTAASIDDLATPHRNSGQLTSGQLEGGQLEGGQLEGGQLEGDAIEVANDSRSKNSGGESDAQITNAVSLSESNTQEAVSDSPGPEQRIVSASYSRDEFASAVLDPTSQQRILEEWDDLDNGESLLISLLRHRDWELRAAALGMLKTVGTTTTLPAVERVYLEGSPREQRLAKETLDGIWARTRADVPDSTSQQNMELIFD